MIHSQEEACAYLQEASTALFEAAKEEASCWLTDDQTAALAGALLHLTFVATHVTEVGRN